MRGFFLRFCISVSNQGVFQYYVSPHNKYSFIKNYLSKSVKTWFNETLQV